MNITEKILARASSKDNLEPGDVVFYCDPDTGKNKVMDMTVVTLVEVGSAGVTVKQTSSQVGQEARKESIDTTSFGSYFLSLPEILFTFFS